MLDTVNAFVSLLDADESVLGRTFNAGSGREISVGDLVRLIAAVMDTDVDVMLDPDRVRPAGSEVMRLVCDATALQAATSWKPQYTLEEGLAHTASWFCNPANLAAYHTDRYNI